MSHENEVSHSFEGLSFVIWTMRGAQMSQHNTNQFNLYKITLIHSLLPLGNKVSRQLHLMVFNLGVTSDLQPPYMKGPPHLQVFELLLKPTQ